MENDTQHYFGTIDSDKQTQSDRILHEIQNKNHLLTAAALSNCDELQNFTTAHRHWRRFQEPGVRTRSDLSPALLRVDK